MAPPVEYYSFRDRHTGRWVAAFGSHDDPATWAAYLDGLETRYARHGAAHAAGRDQLERAGCELVWVVYDTTDHHIEAGIRAHGPRRSASDVDAVGELASSPTAAVFDTYLQEVVPQGVIEVKGGFVQHGLDDHDAVARILGRCFHHSMDARGVNHAFCTSGRHAVPRWREAGGRPLPGMEPAVFPIADHRTIPLVWDRAERNQLPLDVLDDLHADQAARASTVTLGDTDR